MSTIGIPRHTSSPTFSWESPERRYKDYTLPGCFGFQGEDARIKIAQKEADIEEKRQGLLLQEARSMKDLKVEELYTPIHHIDTKIACLNRCKLHN